MSVCVLQSSNCVVAPRMETQWTLSPFIVLVHGFRIYSVVIIWSRLTKLKISDATHIEHTVQPSYLSLEILKKSWICPFIWIRAKIEWLLP